MGNTNISRREFVADAGNKVLTAALLAPLTGFGIHAMSRSVPVPITPIVIDLKAPEYLALATVGGAAYVPNPVDEKKPLIVTRTSETTLAAFSSKCTHFGCKVRLPVNGIIVCPCHNSTFDLSGKVTHGPAKTDLYQLDATLNESSITIKPKKS